jgi:catechol 2,3-dioxygenase-like lactoylglutathione lyase family enzyme
MLDHLIVTVADFDVSRKFYLEALRPLRYEVVLEMGRAVGFGTNGKPEFFIREGEPLKPPIHLAFRSPDRPTVDAFYDAALGSGGIDNGPPGLRTGYHPNYYGAFVIDPDGHNIEAVCHEEC